MSDEQYTRDFAGTQSPGSVVIVTDNIYSPIPSREGTLRFLNSLTDVEQLPNERIGNVDTSHYLGRVDIHRILDEQLAALDPNAQGYQETLAFVNLQRTAQISIELWIDEEAYRIQQMKVDSQFPIIVSGPNGVEQQGSSGFSTVVRYSDFNSAIEIKRPLTASGNVIAGWRTVAHRSQRSSPVLSLRKRYVLLPLRTPGGFALGRDVGTKVLQVCAYSQVDSRRFRMDNFTLMLVGSGLATSGAISFRGSSVLAVRALAAGALAPGVIMLYVAVVNALSGT